MKYKILQQDDFDVRTFRLKNSKGECFWVDIFTDGKIEAPVGADETDESWKKWLGSFVGKDIFIERISPYRYFSGGETYIIK